MREKYKSFQKLVHNVHTTSIKVDYQGLNLCTFKLAKKILGVFCLTFTPKKPKKVKQNIFWTENVKQMEDQERTIELLRDDLRRKEKKRRELKARIDYLQTKYKYVGDHTTETDRLFSKLISIMFIGACGLAFVIIIGLIILAG